MTKANKIEDRKQKYSEPLHQIQDQIGARIITFYRSDIDRVFKIILKYFRPIEAKDIVPESEWEFGYFGRHFVLILPSDLVSSSIDKNLVPQFFELQIKTLFQHAWSEADHDLGYKPQSAPLPPGALRRLAYTSAQAWGADLMFEELFQESTQS
jgi:ppGpp synthetase/RelA/SpoT-type nucleotidyltranferase